MYPYCCIGLITGRINGYPFHGTGCLIAPKVVLTCAHNLTDRKNKKKAMNVRFIPAVNGELGEIFIVEELLFPQ